MTIDIKNELPGVGRWYAVLAHRSFRYFWVSSTISAIGTALIGVTLAFAVLRTSGSPVALGYVLASGAIAQVILLPLGGVWSDRLPRKTVIIAANAVGGVLFGAMGLLLLLGGARVWQFVILSIGSAAAVAFSRPAVSGLVKQMVPNADLQSANALVSLSNNIPRLAGPGIAGVLVVVSGPAWGFLIDGASFFIAVATMIPIPMDELTKISPSHNSFWRDLKAGGREVVTPWIWKNLLAHGFWNLGFVMIFVLGPATLITHGNATGWAKVATGMAIGSVLGASIALRVKTKRPLVTGNLALLTGAFPFAALIVGVSGWGVAVCAAIAMAGADVLNALWSSTLQRHVPPDLLGKVTSYDWMISLSTTPLSYLAAGWMYRSLDIKVALAVPIILTTVPPFIMALASSSRSVVGLERPADQAPSLPVGGGKTGSALGSWSGLMRCGA
jgi:MFS family permease